MEAAQDACITLKTTVTCTVHEEQKDFRLNAAIVNDGLTFLWQINIADCCLGLEVVLEMGFLKQEKKLQGKTG